MCIRDRSHPMRKLLPVLVFGVVGCVGAAPPGGGSGGDDDVQPDAGTIENACPLADTQDTGDLTALKAQLCNVPGTQGARKYYRLSATVPGATGMDIVQ